MSLLKSVTSTKKEVPRRILLYGVEGIGKSTFASQAEKPIFIQTEDGLANIEATAFPLAEKYSDVMQATYELANQEHEYKTLVLDSADWLEKLFFADICDQKGVKTIADIDYGKGYSLALSYWDAWLDLLDQCRANGMYIVILAHSHIIKFADPGNESYDRYVPRLHKLASERLREWCDEVLFATYQTYTTQEDGGFGKTRTRAVGGGERIIKTTERPSHMAKNRANLPDEIPLDFQKYLDLVKGEKKNG